MVITFNNARLIAEFDDWPIGGSNRGKCKFYVEDGGKKGRRVARETTNKNGQWCRPKYTTYSERVVIADGSDNKTYIISLSKGFVSIHRHDFMCAERSSVFQGEPDYDELVKLIQSAEE